MNRRAFLTSALGVLCVGALASTAQGFISGIHNGNVSDIAIDGNILYSVESEVVCHNESGDIFWEHSENSESPLSVDFGDDLVFSGDEVDASVTASGESNEVNGDVLDLLVDLGGIVDIITGNTEKYCDVTANWDAEIESGSGALDTVDLGLVAGSTNQIIDTTSFIVSRVGAKQSDSGTANLVGVGECGSDYEVQLIAESTNGDTGDDWGEVET